MACADTFSVWKSSELRDIGIYVKDELFYAGETLLDGIPSSAAHVQNIGWTGWSRNEESCGSAGYRYRIEAIRIVVRKGAASPGSTTNTFYEK